MTNQNKKRKQENNEEYTEQQDGDVKMVDDIESVLFSEMTSVNSQLISLASKVELADNNYFVQNDEMITEFIQNIHQFLKIFESHKKKVSSDKLTSDNLIHIYQYLDMPTLVHQCQLVSKSWKGALNTVGFSVKLKSEKKTTKLLKSSLVRAVNELKIIDPVTDVFKLLSNCKKFDNLKSLDLNRNSLGVTAISHLSKCSFPNLTELNLTFVEKFLPNSAKQLFENKHIMSKIKKLYVTSNNSKEFIEILSNSQYLKKLSHLKINNTDSEKGNLGLGVLLKEMTELQHLEIRNYNLYNYPNLLTSGSFMNLNYLDISNCSISNSSFADLIVSPNLPKLTTLCAMFLNRYKIHPPDNTIIDLPPPLLNSQREGTLTDLDLDFTDILPFPSLANYCSNLKKLSIELFSSVENQAETKKVIAKLLESPNLSNLKQLTTSAWDEICEILFTNPIYSNLEVLNLNSLNPYASYNVPISLVSNCKNLVKLKSFSGDRIVIQKEAFKNNPTFANINWPNR